MPDTPETEGFTFRDRRRVASEPAPEAAEPTIVVHDRRTATTAPEAAPAAPPEPPRPPVAPPAAPPVQARPAAPLFAPAPPPPAFGAAPAPPAFAGFGGPGMDEPMDAGMPEEPGLPDIRDYLVEFLMMVRSLAAVRLGLVPNPETGRPDIDLEQARIAIDTVAFLIEQLEPSLPAQDRLPLRSMVSDMRNRYVAMMREATGA